MRASTPRHRKAASLPGIPAISLCQPYASLVFERIKRHETRSFAIPAHYVGATAAIHATAAFSPASWIAPDLHELCVREFGPDYVERLPRGAVLGTAVLVRCFHTDDQDEHIIGSDDLIAGDWRAGRFAWELDETDLFRDPIPAKGKQGWWRWVRPA